MAIDFPSSPIVGQTYSYAGVTYTYTSHGVWAGGSTPASGGFGQYTASSAPPSSSNPGDLWYDLSTGVLSIRINDGNSSQWVQIAAPAIGGGGSGGSYTLLLPGVFF